MILQAKKADLDNLSKEELIDRYLKLQDEYFKGKAAREKSKNPKKNSRNSSVAPSQDPYRGRRSTSLREKGSKPLGGQPGHKGATLEPKAIPDIEIRHIPLYCKCCGNDLSEIEEKLEERRQVVDIPPLALVYTEHQLYSKKCSCGEVVKSDFPQGVNTRIQYGSRVAALVAYLSARQYVSYNRISEFFADVFSHPISEGGIQKLLNRIKERAQPVYERIRENISTSACVGGDETGTKINAGKNGKGWFWTWQDRLNTFITASFNRGYQTVEECFPDGLPLGALVSDCWSAQLKTEARAHQLCMAHLLRDLKYLISLSQNKWPIKIQSLFYDAIELKRKMNPEDYYPSNPKVAKLHNRLEHLLSNPPKSKKRDLLKFYNRLEKHKDKLFPFLSHQEIPPDNNASERAIRNVKVKQKVSGQFHSMEGAQTFAIIRSVIDTCIKRGNNVLESLTAIAQWG
jgi:transposase